MLKQWEDLEQEVQQQLCFLKEQEDFIQSLDEVETIFKLVCDKLKNKGFGSTQKQALLKELNKLELSPKASIFRQNCKAYLDQLSAQLKELDQDNLFCTSDIIDPDSYRDILANLKLKSMLILEVD